MACGRWYVGAGLGVELRRSCDYGSRGAAIIGVWHSPASRTFAAGPYFGSSHQIANADMGRIILLAWFLEADRQDTGSGRAR